MPFSLCTLIGPWNPTLDGVPVRGKGAPTVKYRDTAVTCVKTALLIVMPFGLLAQNGTRNHELNGSSTPMRRPILGVTPIVKHRDFLP